MRFNKLIHPEIVRGLRGPQRMLDLYKRNLENVNIKDKDGELNVHKKPITNKPEQLVYKHLQMCKLHWAMNGGSYHFGADFFSNLIKIKKDIPVSLLPKNFYGYLSFPNDAFSGWHSGAVGAYVSIDPIFNDSEFHQHGGMIYNVIYQDSRTRSYSSYTSVLTPAYLDYLETTDPLKFTVPKDREQFKNMAQDMVLARAILNCVSYIHSQNPHMIRIGSSREISNKQRMESIKKLGVANECTVPVTFVNWRWKRPIVYRKDGTQVSGHFRWQPCGQNHEERKLIWIDEHERIFNRERACEALAL